MTAGRVFKFSEPGSRVLREWNEARARERLVQQRAKADMQRNWWSGVAGITMGGFAGASVSRLTASMAQWSGAVNADLDIALVVLRSRARGLAANSEFGRRFLTLCANNIAGPEGPTLQVRAKDDRGQLDKAGNDAIERHWWRWGKRCDVTGRLSFPHLLRVAVKGAARDGETLVRVVRDRNLPYGIALQMLEADRLDESMNTRLNSGNQVRMGVEIDSQLRPVAYWMKSRHPGENHLMGPAVRERIPASEIYHLFLTERAEQVRGYTWLHAVLIRASRLHDYEDAAVVAAQVGAAKMGAFTRKDEASGPPIGQQLGDTQTAAGVPQMNVQAGEFIDLTGMPGVELQSWNPEYPHANFESFLKTCWHGLATGLDVATHNLSGDMSAVNYSSARIAELSERDMWKTLQAWLIDSLVEPIYRDWLASALMLRQITFATTGRALPAELFSKFADASEFQGRRWQWVDPQKEVAASREMIDARLASRTQIAASQGRDFEDIVAELAQEQQMIEAAKLNPTPPAPSAPPRPTEPGPSED